MDAETTQYFRNGEPIQTPEAVFAMLRAYERGNADETPFPTRWWTIFRIYHTTSPEVSREVAVGLVFVVWPHEKRIDGVDLSEHCEIGILVSRLHRRKGISWQACNLIFQAMPSMSFFATSHPANVVSIQSLHKLGFVRQNQIIEIPEYRRQSSLTAAWRLVFLRSANAKPWDSVPVSSEERRQLLDPQ
jgi:RimJ/RimL family protein N-acetyltransferase